jgi:hypothetical protein
MENYNKVKECVEEYKCTLLTSFEEFENRRKQVNKEYYGFVRITFIGTCGHESSAVYTNFLKRKTGINCKSCVLNKFKNREKISCSLIETNSINIIEKYLQEDYEIIRTKEGCKADIVLRKLTEQKYIPVQVKSTNSINHTMYSFNNVNNNYNDMLIICVCIKEEKLWIFPYESINHIKRLNISKTSKYNKYIVNSTNITKIIDEYSLKCFRDSIDELLIPQSIHQKREQEYVKKRESYINFLTYTYPSEQNTPTDFLIGNKKIQEKVCGYLPKRSAICVHLASNHGKKENGIRNWRTYRLGENDFYWFHSSIDDRFWIVPEVELFNRSYLSKPEETSNKQIFVISSNLEWLQKYEYNYLYVDIDKIKKIFD